MTVEREIKVTATADFEMPDLTGLAPDSTVTALSERRLVAVYFDTEDLRLARSGITLRHRVGDGESTQPWTVKLPETNQGPGLTRREIRFAGQRDHVPEAAADLVLATTRGHRLEPAAQLGTIRVPHEIRDAKGVLLAEVVDDTVSVTHGHESPGGFREIEVEAYGKGRAARRLLDESMARLVGAGAAAEPPIPKLVRALATRAAQSPDVTVSPLGDDATVAHLVRHTVARSVAQMLRHDPGVRLGDDPEDVHQFRVATRRLRSDLRTFARLLDAEQVGPVREELGWLGGVVGAVRDTDVLAVRLRTNSATLPEADAAGARKLLGRLDKEGAAARATMLTTLREPRYLALLDNLIELTAALPTVDDELARRAAAEAAARFVRRPWRHLVDAAAALGSDATDTELHQTRIQAKRCRYAAEAVVPAVGRPAERLADAVADLQTVLGDHQDTVVSEAWLRAAAAAIPSGRVAAGQLIAVELAQRADLRARWPDVWQDASAKKLRRWL